MRSIPLQQINIKLDLTQGWINNRQVELKQSDNETRYLVVRVTNQLPLDITGALPLVFIKRNDGKIFQVLGTVINQQEGEFMFPLKTQHLAINGKLVIEVALFKDGNKMLSFPSFNLNVVDSIHDETELISSEEDAMILWQLINEVKQLKEEMMSVAISYDIIE